MFYYDNYLAHHGVKGMKWGVRKQRILKGRKRGSSNQTSEKKKWSTKKKVAVGAAIVGGTALAAIGGYVIYKKKKDAKYLADIRKSNEMLKELETRGRKALEISSYYTEANKYGQVIARKTAEGTSVEVFKNGVKAVTW